MPLFVNHRAAPLIAALVLIVGIAGALAMVDAFTPDALPAGFSSLRQLIGIDVLLILIPSYMAGAWGLADRRSWMLLGQVDALLGEPVFQPRARTPAWKLLAGALLGVVYAIVFNLPIQSLDALLAGGPLLMVLVALMILVWLSVGVVLASRLHVSGVFFAAGRRVPVDLYDHRPLEPFARAGMGDMVFVVGALVLSTVQSIDVTFRYQNYLYALAVAVPAGLILLLRPMASLHARLRALKRQEVSAVTALIQSAPRALQQDAMRQLEALLKRRERAQEVYTWPIDVAMVSRLLLYGVIPPAAWVAAALVEHLVDSTLGG